MTDLVFVFVFVSQILCNFYDENDDLFYTISLSTAMGSINKLSTIKSVFIVPINKNMTKIKIDFFIMPKPTQQNRSAKFIIKDINSNKIYVKYYQKTDEISIKNIEDSLNKIDNLEKSLYLKNLLNVLYHDKDLPIEHIFFEKTFALNAKRNDFLEIYFKLLIKYDDTQNAKHVVCNIILYDNDIELYSKSYENIDYLSNSNTEILLNCSFHYNFDNDVNDLRIVITFSQRRSYVNISYSFVNNNKLVIKHYGN